jgi:hypothetical protein
MRLDEIKKIISDSEFEVIINQELYNKVKTVLRYGIFTIRKIPQSSINRYFR